MRYLHLLLCSAFLRLLLFISLSFTFSVHAALVGRDLDGISSTYEAFYDDVLDVTWQANANLSASETFGVQSITADGRMSVATANTWVAAANSENYFGYNDWRLPVVVPSNGLSFDMTISYDGSTDKGYGNSSASSELSHLFYATLGNIGRCSVASTSSCDVQAGSGLENTGPFANIQSAFYATGSSVVTDTLRTFFFSTSLGAQTALTDNNLRYAWLLRDGDTSFVPELISVGEVPLPPAFWLLGSALLALRVIRR